MKHIDIKQAHKQLPDLVDQVQAGEEIMITRKGKTVARLVQGPKAPKQLPSLEVFRRGIGRTGSPAVQLLREERDA